MKPAQDFTLSSFGSAGKTNRAGSVAFVVETTAQSLGEPHVSRESGRRKPAGEVARSPSTVLAV